MFNPTQKLNPKLSVMSASDLDNLIEQKPTRDGFGEALLRLGEQDERIVVLTGDLKESTRVQAFADKFPDRFVECGVAEQNMMGVAAGLALAGKIPFAASYATFSPGRNWDQFRVSVCYSKANVKVIGAHTGVSVGPDGATHQALEDIALMRVIPNMEVYSPCDSIEAKKVTLALAKSNKPAYLRLAREKTPIITTEDTPMNLGKAEIFWMPDLGMAEVGIIATGSLLYRALLAAKELEAEGVKTKVLNLFTIKPLDKEAILALAKECRAIVTVEEHQVAGGMGSAVAEFLAENFPIPMEFVGVKDKFGQSGTPDELVEHYGMGKDSIKEAVKKLIKRKI
jgi:transketolase